eukprot:TRINITY_DN2368_c0_g1_i1.p1 TRINITY_DN2368_c0_g1~~TRINITY_DN2368_c0_g1_i1.p1  ORF type:complete len:144 (-),score=32.40 TRINITY_DN2368_c0_g1_i1:122-553(-)
MTIGRLGYSYKDPLADEDEGDSIRLQGEMYAIGFPTRGFSLLNLDVATVKKGQPLPIYYNPEDRFTSTVLPGIPHPLFNATLAALGIFTFFLPLFPARARSKVAEKKVSEAIQSQSKRAPSMVKTLLNSTPSKKGRMRKGRGE